MRGTERAGSAYARAAMAARICAAALWTLIMCLVLAKDVLAGDEKSKGQKIYLPVYSSIAHLSRNELNLTVTLSMRNLDGSAPITLIAATYFDSDGGKVKDLLGSEHTLAPFGSTEAIIERDDFRGDVGANLVVEWSSSTPVTPPLIEAVMVGFRGTQAFAFTSRGIVLEETASR